MWEVFVFLVPPPSLRCPWHLSKGTYWPYGGRCPTSRYETCSFALVDTKEHPSLEDVKFDHSSFGPMNIYDQEGHLLLKKMYDKYIDDSWIRTVFHHVFCHPTRFQTCPGLPVFWFDQIPNQLYKRSYAPRIFALHLQIRRRWTWMPWRFSRQNGVRTRGDLQCSTMWRTGHMTSGCDCIVSMKPGCQQTQTPSFMQKTFRFLMRCHQARWGRKLSMQLTPCTKLVQVVKHVQTWKNILDPWF